MAKIHVYPALEENLHNLESGDCFCEPKIIDEGLDMNGDRALVFVHSKIHQKDWMVKRVADNPTRKEGER